MAPDFGAISRAYGISYVKTSGLIDINEAKPYFETDGPSFIEVALDDDTYVFPKLAVGKPNEDQEPELDRELFSRIMEL